MRNRGFRKANAEVGPLIYVRGNKTPTRGLTETQIDEFYAEVNRIRMKKFAEQRRMMPRFARRAG